MPRKKKKSDSDNPKPLNFDHDQVKGPGDRLKKPFMSPADIRGDNKDDQYYDAEETLSPEEAKARKEEGNL